MNTKPHLSQNLAAAITKTASKQTYYTIRFFVDRQRVDDAYRAYGYFRWVDDVLDARTGDQSEKIRFVNRQSELLDALYRGETPLKLCDEEEMLSGLVRHDTEENSGLRIYLRKMMGVMNFDSRRRGLLISQSELTEYSRMLATAVTEAMYYFIGHDDPVPGKDVRYLPVIAAHITHMLRDTFEDVDAGYFNIPREYLDRHRISPYDTESEAYRKWIRHRVQLAQRYFKAGRSCLAQVKSLRCRLAGYVYTARFEWVLRTIEQENFCLRSAYEERKSLWAGLWMGWSTLESMFMSPWIKNRVARHGSITQSY